MRRRTRYNNRDLAEGPIVRDLLRCGASVEKLPGGNGRPDLIVGYSGGNHLLEVKSDKKTHHKKGDGRSDAQKKWAAGWKGRAPHTVSNSGEALKAIGALR